jgi:hypothetical protein
VESKSQESGEDMEARRLEGAEEAAKAEKIMAK